MTEPRDPDFVFETSWEVANMVGGIHTVLASKAREMRDKFGDDYLCIGPRVQTDLSGVFATQELFPGLEGLLQPLGIGVLSGRWKVPGEPRALLVDFSQLYKQKNEVLEWLWLNFKVDSITGGWDYVEPVLFSYAAGQVIEALSRAYLLPERRHVACIWHEWMVGAGLLYLKLQAPELAQMFVTHATVLGRAICGTGGSLREAVAENNPQAIARRLNVASKHSLESTVAREADCFATVSATTAEECTNFLGRAPDVLVHNGIGEDYPPGISQGRSHAALSREAVLHLAERMSGTRLNPRDTRLVISAGRYEYVNKGLNLAVDAMAQAGKQLAAQGLRAVFMTTYPTAVTGPDRELLQASREGVPTPQPLVTTHWPQDRDQDPLLAHFARVGLVNHADDPVLVVNAPIYLDGRDSIVPMRIYDLMPAFDLSLYPSAYEPWGYTPLESLAFRVPTVTSDLAGMGRWVRTLEGASPDACLVLPRADVTYEHARDQLATHIVRMLSMDGPELEHVRAECWEIARRAQWSHFIVHYMQALQFALVSRSSRRPGAAHTTSVRRAKAPDPPSGNQPRMHPFTVRANLPLELAGLRKLAANLWWTWHPKAAGLFRSLSPDSWTDKHHNPLKVLESLPRNVIDECVQDAAFMADLKAALQEFDEYMGARLKLNARREVGYFCMEYGLHESMPFYSGGLGVLSGDTLKAASDANLSMVAVGLAYRRGSFKQSIDHDGNQTEEYPTVDFTTLPLHPVEDKDCSRLLVYVRFPGRAVAVQAWRVEVGSVPLYLLDTDHPNNSHADREITAVLYAGDRERRLQQEIVLGIGGSKLLHTLNEPPSVFHMNESHTAFLSLDRQFALMRDGEIDYPTAFEYCRQTSVFTTHTPIGAGHESYKEDLLRPYLFHYQDRLHRGWDNLMAMGRVNPGDPDFSLSVMAVRNSVGINGVSKIHRRVSQKMFSDLLPGFHESETPICAITNGAHHATWLATEWQERFDTLFQTDWRSPEFDGWDRIREIPAAEFRAIRSRLKKRLMADVMRRLQISSHARGDSAVTLARIIDAVHRDALVIGFARRFVPYKRPTLMFQDLEGFKALLDGDKRPVLFLFAGKAHPQDLEGKRLIREIFQLSRREPFVGKVLFLEGYDLALARLLVRGCDVWLNNPTRPLEASGTSGMKSAMNGGLNLSVLDGWWAEGYHGDNGWAIEGISWFDGSEIRHDARVLDQSMQTDEADCERIHWLMRQEIIPRYFDGGEGWVDFSKAAMISALREFSAARMLREYNEQFYVPAIAGAAELARDSCKAAHNEVEANERITRAWPNVRILECDAGRLEQGPIAIGDRIELKARLSHPGLTPADLEVELVTTMHDDQGHEHDPGIGNFRCIEESGDVSQWAYAYKPKRTGPRAYGVRVLPIGAHSQHGIKITRALVHWA